MNPNLAAFLEQQAAAHPERPAIIDRRGGKRRVASFRVLADRVAAVAAGLAARGVAPGDRVLLFVPMSLDLYVALLGVLHLGAQAVFVDAWAGRARIDAAIAAAAPRAWIAIPRAQLLRLQSPAVRAIPISILAGGLWPLARLERPAARRPAAVVDPASAALVTFTTGSTGKPKAAARSHRFLWAQHRALAAHLALREDDIDMATLPVFVLNNLALGVTSVIADFDPRRPADIDPVSILAQIREERVSTLVASPAFCAKLVEHSMAAGGTLPLRRLFTGGAPVLPPLLRGLVATMPEGAEVLYGSTEAEPISGIDVQAMLEAITPGGGAAPTTGLCVGAPVPEIALKIVRADDGPIELDASGWRPRELPVGETGEIVVSGAHVLPGYLDDPEADRANKVRHGAQISHRTGDAGYLDLDGRLWLMGRVKRRVCQVGVDWWPLPAELRAFTLPSVTHAAYLSLPGSDRALLCIEGPTPEEHANLENELRQRLAPWPLDQLIVLETIPRDPRHHSKTDHDALVALLTKTPR
ncbi:MAG: AMP-binding protein [Candidatus Eisenbacteria bacterium]|nr:AMP-binding protein [Candidatus Eisenbacteria bacterium]